MLLFSLLMKSLKKGFTLAEILIALSLIGIIAAMMIPQLIDNTKRNRYGATLGKAVQQIELGISNMIQQANDNYSDGSIATTLDLINVADVRGEAITNPANTLTNSFNLFELGQPYLGIEGINETEATDYYENTDTNFSHGRIHLYKFNKFNAYVMYSAQKTGTLEGNDIYTIVAIDVNGNSKPNKIGRDIFGFGLTTTGKLTPAGTEKLKEFAAHASPDFGNNVPLAEDGCKDGNITNGWSCTARVIQDGFKINY